MQRYARILSAALDFVWQRKKLWLIAFLQFVSLPLAIRTLRSFNNEPLAKTLSAFSLLVVFSLATVILWLAARAYIEKQTLDIRLNDFLKAAAAVFGFSALGIFIGLTLKNLGLHWTAFVFLLSVVNSILVAIMLASVLFGLNFKRSLALTLDFWNHKMSFISTSIFVVLVAHGLSYYLAHAFWPRAMRGREFSVSDTHATIWILALVLAVVAAFFASFLNAFLVMLFLDTAKPKKAPEAVTAAVPQPATGI